MRFPVVSIWEEVTTGEVRRGSGMVWRDLERVELGISTALGSQLRTSSGLGAGVDGRESAEPC